MPPALPRGRPTTVLPSRLERTTAAMSAAVPDRAGPRPTLAGFTAAAAEPAAGRGGPTAGARHDTGGAPRWRRERSDAPAPDSGG